MASYIDPSFRESLLKSAQNRTAQVNFKKLLKKYIKISRNLG